MDLMLSKRSLIVICVVAVTLVYTMYTIHTDPMFNNATYSELLATYCEREIESAIKEQPMDIPIPYSFRNESEEFKENFRQNRRRNEAEMKRVMPVLEKYHELIWRQPNVHGFGPGNLEDENGEETEEFGITVYVTKKVPQDQLPPEDRIPDRVGCVRIQIIEKPNESDFLSLPALRHRPLRAGVGFTTPIGSGRGVGTLTGLATRNSDGKKVLVTNLHTLNAGHANTVRGDEELFQPDNDHPT